MRVEKVKYVHSMLLGEFVRLDRIGPSEELNGVRTAIEVVERVCGKPEYKDPRVST